MSTTQVKHGSANPEQAASATGLGPRARFLNACWCESVDRPPVWLMRQAGRALPEYRLLKEKHSFLELVQTPELAMEVTLQPVRRFGFDAAILFSDILVIPEAMGQRYGFPDSGGVVMDYPIRTREDIARLSAEAVTERLGYVDKALRLLRAELGSQTALIGFAGSPWTLATFMMEGGSAETYTRALALFREDRKSFYLLAEKLTAAVTAYLNMQIEAGVDALQIFDSHGGHLAPAEFQEASGRWMKEIIASVAASCATRSARNAGAPRASWQTANEPAKGRVPVIVFSLGTHGNWDDLVATGANVLGIDWRFPLSRARDILPRTVALQGNLPPALLSDATPEAVAHETRRLLVEMQGRSGYIVNLGHGVTPAAKLENIAALVETVRSFK